MPQYKDQPNVNPNQYTPLSQRVKKLLGRGPKDIDLPAEGTTKRPSPPRTLTTESARGIVKGFGSLRELTKSSRSPSKR